jgi:8-oxo-dGTP diphosphatase
VPHIHPLYDFVTSVFIVRRGRVLLVHHKKYREWLPIGGHVELDEDPEQALYREIREECGLKVRILADRPDVGHRGVKPLPTPSYMDAHRIGKTHRHVAFVYFGVSASDRVKLHAREHSEFRWFSKEELKEARPRLTRSIRFYCLRALEAGARAR